MTLINKLYHTSPYGLWQKVRLKIGQKDQHDLGLQEVLQSSKYMRAQRMFDFLNRYELILKRLENWKPLEFEGKAVMDFGGGPLLGWGPLAVFRGAKRVVCSEPIVRAEILKHPQVIERYFLPMYRDLTAIYGNKFSSFDKFQKAIDEKITVFTHDNLDNGIEGKFDIMLSNSCLEHIFQLEESLRRMREISEPGARFLHCVDFGNHRNARKPFSGIYNNEPEDYWRRYGRLINLIRPHEMQEIFEKCGFTTTMTPYYYSPELYDETICPYWQNRCDKSDQFLKVAFLSGTTP